MPNNTPYLAYLGNMYHTRAQRAQKRARRESFIDTTTWEKKDYGMHLQLIFHCTAGSAR